jgi:DNA-binding protein YbaB
MAFTRSPGEWVQRLEQLQAEAQQLWGLLAAASSTPASYEGYDRTGAVQVLVDQDGQVRDIQLSGSWRSHIDPRDLGPAVVEAVGAAVNQRAAAWAEPVATGAGRRGRAAGDAEGAAAEPGQSAFGPLLGGPLLGDGLSGRQLLDLLDGVEAELDGFQQRVRQWLARGAEGRSDGGHVTAVLAGGQLSRVEIDPRWAAQARHTEIGREIRLAVQQAQATDQRSKPAPGDVGSSFSELQAMVRGDLT